MKSALFDRRFAVVAGGREPTIREMIQHYYTSHGISLDQAREWTDRVVDAAMTDMAP